MNKIDVIISIILFVLLIIIFYVFNLRKINILLGKKKNKSKKTQKKLKKIDVVEFKYLVYKYKIKEENLLSKKMVLIVALINSLIITLTFIVISILPIKIMWQLMIGFVLLFGLIYSLYGILGLILKKRGY